MTYMGKESEKEWIYMYVWRSHFAVHLKLTQHCKSIILQFKKRKSVDQLILDSGGINCVRKVVEGPWGSRKGRNRRSHTAPSGPVPPSRGCAGRPVSHWLRRWGFLTAAPLPSQWPGDHSESCFLLWSTLRFLGQLWANCYLCCALYER